MARQVKRYPGQPGRPPKAPDEARSRRTVTFLTEGEYRKLENIARRNNLSISSAAHHLLLQSINTWDCSADDGEQNQAGG